MTVIVIICHETSAISVISYNFPVSLLLSLQLSLLFLSAPSLILLEHSGNFFLLSITYSNFYTSLSPLPPLPYSSALWNLSKPSSLEIYKEATRYKQAISLRRESSSEVSFTFSVLRKNRQCVGRVQPQSECKHDQAVVRRIAV